MFRRLAANNFKRCYAYSKGPSSFTVRPKPPQRRWVPWAIFGTSFITGLLLTQHMTLTDLLAFWKYDKLPQGSPEVDQYKLELTQRCENLSVVKQLKQAGFTEVFPNRRQNDLLVANTLDTPGGIAVAPRFYHNPLTKETVGIYHLGMKLTGYPFIVHGGILATVLEDLMQEAVKLTRAKPGKKTKELVLSYKMPTFANQFVVVRTTKVEEFGKNTKLHAQIMDQTGNTTLINGKGTFST